MTSPSTPGLLFVYGEPGDHVSEQDFNDWYDGEHVPARTTVPGFLSLIRYKAADGKKPSWLALYDLSSPDVIKSEAYSKLASTASDNERTIVSNLAVLNRRVYSFVSSRALPTATPESFPAKFVFVVLMQPTPEGEADFNKWYEEEHLELLSKVPGWLRCRRFKLVGSATELAGKADPADTSSNPKLTYLALHEMDNNAGLNSPEFNHALSTPWCDKIRADVGTGLEMRLFEVYKIFDKAN